MKNVLTGREAFEILQAIDAEQVLSDDLRDRLTKLQEGYDRRRVAALQELNKPSLEMPEPRPKDRLTGL